MRRREFAVTAGAGFIALAGCLGGPSGTPDEPDDGTESTGQPSETEPAYATCASGTVSADAPESAGNLPPSLAHEDVVGYVESVERDIVLPPDADGYVKIGAVTTESVSHGVVAEVPVTGGYYNEPGSDGSTGTVHADLAPHTARYFVTPTLCRRVKTRDGTADPREEGELLACTTA